MPQHARSRVGRKLTAPQCLGWIPRQAQRLPDREGKSDEGNLGKRRNRERLRSLEQVAGVQAAGVRVTATFHNVESDQFIRASDLARWCLHHQRGCSKPWPRRRSKENRGALTRERPGLQLENWSEAQVSSPDREVKDSCRGAVTGVRENLRAGVGGMAASNGTASRKEAGVTLIPESVWCRQ